MRSVFIKFLVLLSVSAAAYGQVNPHTQIRWPLTCSNPHMVYNWANDKCEATNQVQNDYPFSNDMTGHVIGCVQSDGSVHRCPVNSLTWTGIQIAGGVGTAQSTATLTSAGQAVCQFDGLTTAGHFVQVSALTAGYCHDAGAVFPQNGQPVVGQILSVNTDPTQATIVIMSGGGIGPPGPPGPPGGSTSYPGVTSDNNNGLNVQGALTTSASQGYRQNTLNARARNRDEVLQITVTPQDMQGCAQSGGGYMDDTPCFNAAIAYLNSSDAHATKRLLVPWTFKGYSLQSAGYLMTLPYDFGDYHGYGGFITAGNINPVVVVNGIITSCSFSGGTGYAPNATMQVMFQDPAMMGISPPPASGVAFGSGATATVSTDATGTLTGCTVTNGGMNYPPTGTAAIIIPAGGDLAAGTCSLGTTTLGQFNSPCTVTAGGSGYASGVPVGMPGLTCTTYPTQTATVTNAAIATVTTTAGSGCSYTGSTGPISVPLFFGASCSQGASHCALMAPETPINLPCAIATIPNLTIEGMGSPAIATTWDGTTVNNSQTIAFCDPTGTQTQSITFKNLTVKAFIDFYFPLEADNVIWDNVQFQGGLPIYSYSFGTYQYTNGHLNFARSLISNSNSTAWIPGIVCSAAWAGRNPTTNSGSYQQALAMQLGAIGRFQWTFNIGSYNNPYYGGRCSGIDVKNFVTFTGATQAQANTFDQWFEANIWKTQWGPTNANTYTDATHLLSNGIASGWGTMGGLGCKITQTITTDRTTDYAFGYPARNQPTYPYYQCFPGVASTFFTSTPRYSSNDVQFFGAGMIPPQLLQSVITQGAYRSVVNGRFDTLQAVNLDSGFCGGSTYVDPYKQTGQTSYAFNVTSQVPSNVQVINHAVNCNNIVGVGLKANLMSFGINSNAGLWTQNVNSMTTNPTQTQTPAGAFIQLGTTAIAAGTCGATLTAAQANVAANDTIIFHYSAPPGGSTGLLTVNAWPTAGNVNFSVCNPTAASITPTNPTFLYYKVTR